MMLQILGVIIILIGMIGMFVAGYGCGQEAARQKDSDVEN